MISVRDEADYHDMIAASPCLRHLPKTRPPGSTIRTLLKNADATN
jgi:hypothetical protein